MAEEQKKPETAPTTETATTEVPAEGAAAPKKKKNKKKRLTEGVVNIHASYNNTIVSVADMSGNVVCWASSGGCGFKGTRKATPYASSVAAETALSKAKALGLEKVHISVKGVGTGRDQALRAINASGVAIESISDKTAIPHNGCRPRKARRV
ncbi:30S ribosomal protein S11 [Candidatus Gracilibacteria bacterium]|nr:30S ribosomal protein S11 [Candidatus Gracilibacteria bacterium]